MSFLRLIPTLAFMLYSMNSSAQQAVSSIVTSNDPATPVSYMNVKGAGQKNAMGVVSSLWDSVGTSFTVNFNATSTNTRLMQFSVSGHPAPYIPVAVNAQVRIRRMGNSFVSDARNHFNFWSEYQSIPVANSTSGTFNITGPEVLSAETALLSNNLNSGYDNIFQNTINNLHSGNIERIDFIIPPGVRPTRQYDIDHAGVVVLDRGTGDPFKVAAITSLDANNDPLTFGPLVSVTALQYGPNLLSSSFNYAIFIHDPAFGIRSRPSSQQNQNIRGVFASFGNLGVSVGQRIYGYAIFGQDVVAAVADWTTYPSNTNAAAMLDPVNLMAIYRDVNSILPVPLSFELSERNSKAFISLTIFEKAGERLQIERSYNGKDFIHAGTIEVQSAGTYSFVDHEVSSGQLYYRIRSDEADGKASYSEIKFIRISNENGLEVYPNPASEYITLTVPLSWSNKKLSMVLYNASGSRLTENRFSTTGPKRIPLHSLNNGIYYMKLTNEETGEQSTRQLVIVK